VLTAIRENMHVQHAETRLVSSASCRVLGGKSRRRLELDTALYLPWLPEPNEAVSNMLS
jgi:hypothetical protein